MLVQELVTVGGNEDDEKDEGTRSQRDDQDQEESPAETGPGNFPQEDGWRAQG